MGSKKIFCMSKLLWVQTDFKTFFLRITAAYRSFLLPTTAHLIEITSTYSNCVFIIRHVCFFFKQCSCKVANKKKNPYRYGRPIRLVAAAAANKVARNWLEIGVRVAYGQLINYERGILP